VTAATRLSRSALPGLPPHVGRPGYDLAGHPPAIVHFGPGAFFRAHQCAYVDTLLESDPRWGICAVALRSSGVRDALAGQDRLYTLAILDRHPSMRVLGPLKQVLVASQEAAAVRERLASPATRLVTATVTEKGYCLTPDGDLDLEHPDIRHDLSGGIAPTSLIGWLVDGYRMRRAEGLMPFTVASCDNLSGNGERLRRAVLQFARRTDARLADWIEGEARFPSTMVDSITPATDDALKARVAAETGVADAWPIQREAFTQWVIEDSFCGERPALDRAGATFTTDVGAFERAKLRLLNGTHSTLAYLGLLAGHETVADAMADEPLAALVEAMMREEIEPTLDRRRGLDLPSYIDAVLARFRNPAIRHMLSQIAWDGSQKLPIRLLGTIGDRIRSDAPFDRLALGVAAWMRFVRMRARQSVPITDPLDGQLAEIGLACEGHAEADVDRFLRLTAVFPPALAAVPSLRTAIVDAYAALCDPAAAIAASLSQTRTVVP
jgi:fructuronate reductase